MYGQGLNGHAINSLKKVNFSWNICSWLYRKQRTQNLTIIDLEKRQAMCTWNPVTTRLNYVNNIVDQRHQYGVLVEGPTSLASVAGGIV